jgi:hypothetical protein
MQFGSFSIICEFNKKIPAVCGSYMRWFGSRVSLIPTDWRGISTKLSPAEIAQVCRDAFYYPSAADYAIQFFYAIGTVCAIIGVAAIINLYLSSSSWLSDTAALNLVSKTDISFFVALILFTAVGLVLISRGRLWEFGIRVPIGIKDWLILLPVLILSAMGNDVYFPNSAFHLLKFNESVIYIFIAIPLALELLFRGLAHGILAGGTTAQSCNS